MSISTIKEKVLIVASTDASKGELFTLFGTPKEFKDGSLIEKVVRPEQLGEEIDRYLDKLGRNSKWVAIGEGRSRYPQVFGQISKGSEIESTGLFPNQIQGRSLGFLAFKGFQSNQLLEGLQVNPRYIRSADAELKLKAGLLKSGPSRGIS
jgi:hypothetical protein